MDIIYAQNPLASKIILDERDVKVARNSLQCDVFHFALIDIESDYNNRTKEEILSFAKSREDVEEYLNIIIGEANLEHVGDCTCCPSSCLKCQLEEALHVDTLGKGFNKRIGCYIATAFKQNDSAVDALSFLRCQAKVCETWSADYLAAADYLEKYIDEKLKEPSK